MMLIMESVCGLVLCAGQFFNWTGSLFFSLFCVLAVTVMFRKYLFCTLRSRRAGPVYIWWYIYKYKGHEMAHIVRFHLATPLFRLPCIQGHTLQATMMQKTHTYQGNTESGVAIWNLTVQEARQKDGRDYKSSSRKRQNPWKFGGKRSFYLFFF